MWTAALHAQFAARDKGVAACVAAAAAHPLHPHVWQLYTPVICAGSHVVAWFSNDSDCWYCGRCVGTRGFDNATSDDAADLYLVRFDDLLHLWALRSSLVGLLLLYFSDMVSRERGMQPHVM